jgi:hypothetical protein
MSRKTKPNRKTKNSNLSIDDIKNQISVEQQKTRNQNLLFTLIVHHEKIKDCLISLKDWLIHLNDLS